MAAVEINEMGSRLVLGTAQLGMPYGIANLTGKPAQETATEIIQTAWETGIREFDTAQKYGESELVLGKALRILGITDQARIITKLDPETRYADSDTFRRVLGQSFQRLGVSRLFGIMLHKESLLDEWHTGLGDICRQIAREGLVEQIGISVYSPVRALEALQNDDFSIIQLPANILDTRFEQAGVFALAEEKGKSIYIRSIFLQGLLLMDGKKLPDKISFAGPVIQKVEQLARELSLSRVELAVGYLFQKYPRAALVFGAEGPGQVRGTTRAMQHLPAKKIWQLVDARIGDVPELLIRPDRWPQ